MNKSELFKAAHALAKQVIQSGDDYRATFGAAIKHLLTTRKVSSEKIEDLQMVMFAGKREARFTYLRTTAKGNIRHEFGCVATLESLAYEWAVQGGGLDGVELDAETVEFLKTALTA